MSRSRSASRVERPRRARPVTFCVCADVTVALLQRLEAAMAKAGRKNRAALIVELLERWTTDKGC